MKTAAGILGIIAGVIGIIAAVLAFGISGVASLVPAARETGTLVFYGAWLALAASVAGLVGGSFAFTRPKAAGWLMLLAALAGLIGISWFWSISGPLFLLGGILGLAHQSEKSDAVTPRQPEQPPPPPALAPAPQPRFTWRPAQGQTLSLPDELHLVTSPQLNAAWAGSIPAQCEFTVILSRPGWIYVQREDGSLEGWAQVP